MSDLEQPLDGSRVLVVEDQYYLAEEMRKMVLQLGGHVVGPAKDVQSALALLQNVPAPDLAILDVNLNGTRIDPVAETLRDRGIPLMFATGYEVWALSSRLPEEPIVAKPVTVAPLTAAILEIRRSHREFGL